MCARSTSTSAAATWRSPGCPALARSGANASTSSSSNATSPPPDRPSFWLALSRQDEHNASQLGRGSGGGDAFVEEAEGAQVVPQVGRDGTVEVGDARVQLVDGSNAGEDVRHRWVRFRQL